MSAAERMEELAQQCLSANEQLVETGRELDRRTLTDAQRAYDQSCEPVSRSRQPYLAKLAVAATIVLAVILGTLFFDGSDGSAYAIEQTMVALKNITTIHVVGTDWDGNRYEAWNRVDPATGEVVWCCIDQTPVGYRIASRPDGSCVWDGDGNVVRYSNQVIASNDFRYTRVFEQIAEKMGRLSEDDHVTVQTETDPGNGRSLIVIHVVTQVQDYRVYVDRESKLPVRLLFDRADNMQQIARTADEIHYNVPLPDGMFDFEVPREWYRDWSLLDDPTKGLAIGTLTPEQGAVRTAKAYWQAVIDDNWVRANRLRPVADWKSDYHKDRPAELIDVGTPRVQRGCTGLVTPCIVRFQDGRLVKVELVIDYREIAGQRSCIIVATWGWPTMLSEN